jgi:hypothetical protein
MQFFELQSSLVDNLASHWVLHIINFIDILLENILNFNIIIIKTFAFITRLFIFLNLTRRAWDVSSCDQVNLLLLKKTIFSIES